MPFRKAETAGPRLASTAHALAGRHPSECRDAGMELPFQKSRCCQNAISVLESFEKDFCRCVVLRAPLANRSHAILLKKSSKFSPFQFLIPSSFWRAFRLGDGRER